MSSLPDQQLVSNWPNNTNSLWRPRRVIDLREVGKGPGICDRCDRRDLRFLHILEHPDEAQVQVGRECARRLCFDYSPEREERRLRNLWARRSRWLMRNWGTSRNGNETLTLRLAEGEKVRVTVFLRFGAWAYSIGDKCGCHFSRERFTTSDTAKLAAFDALAIALGWAEPSEVPTADTEGDTV